MKYLRRIPTPLVQRAVMAYTGPTSEKTRPDVVNRIREIVASANIQSVRWAIRSVVPYRIDQHARMQQIRCPVLVVAGEEDRTFPVTETKAMADAIPGSRFIVLPKIGHLAAMEAPEVVNAEVEWFLAAV